MRRISGRDFLSAILIQADRAENMERIQQEVTAVLQQRRGGREPDFMVRSQLELAEAATATAKTMTALIGSVAAIPVLLLVTGLLAEADPMFEGFLDAIGTFLERSSVSHVILIGVATWFTAGALRGMVEQCNTELGLGMFPEEVSAVAAVLNRDHYRFR